MFTNITIVAVVVCHFTFASVTLLNSGEVASMLSGKDVLIWGNKMIIKMFNVHKQEHQPGIAHILFW